MVVKFGLTPDDFYILEATDGEGVYVIKYLNRKQNLFVKKPHY